VNVFVMKLVLLLVATAWAPSVTAFSAYLSQLSSGGAAANVNGANRAGVYDNHAPYSPQPTAPRVGPSQEMLDLISKQVSVELMASQTYMSASIWFRSREFDGMAAWMLEESDEERGHGKEILEFAMKSHFPIKLEQLPAPAADWTTPDQVWQDILRLEENNTQNLLKIAAAANACQQFGVMAFLDPFHMEQVEAEDKVGNILAKVRGASGTLLQELDHQLGQEAAQGGHH
jgi:ferritin